MPNFKLVAPYCGVRKYDKRFFVYYLETEENIRREYIFNTDEDVSNFSHALENLTAFMKNVPVRKKEAYHQEFLDLLLREVDHKLNIRTNPVEPAAAASQSKRNGNHKIHISQGGTARWSRSVPLAVGTQSKSCPPDSGIPTNRYPVRSDVPHHTCSPVRFPWLKIRSIRNMRLRARRFRRDVRQ